MPKSLKIAVPANANAESTMKQVQQARAAMRRRVSESCRAVITRNVGITAKRIDQEKNRADRDQRELDDVRGKCPVHDVPDLEGSEFHGSIFANRIGPAYLPRGRMAKFDR